MSVDGADWQPELIGPFLGADLLFGVGMIGHEPS